MSWVTKPVFLVALWLTDVAIFFDFASWCHRLNHVVALFFWRVALDLAWLWDVMSGIFGEEDLRLFDEWARKY